MEEKEYVFFNTYYDKELLRRALIVLNQEGIDFKVSDKSSRTSSRAPLSVYVEVDIMVLSSDIVRTARLLDLSGD